MTSASVWPAAQVALFPFAHLGDVDDRNWHGRAWQKFCFDESGITGTLMLAVFSILIPIAGEAVPDCGMIKIRIKRKIMNIIRKTGLSPNRHTVVTEMKLCDESARDMQAGVKPRILVVDDEPEAVELVEFNLKQAGYAVTTAGDGAEALKKARAQTPDLIVLDVMLPEMDGFEICKMLRLDPATAQVPIIMLTAKAAEIDRVLGLELGADDYLTKPFSPRELLLRIKKILARGQAEEKPSDQLRFGDLLIDVPRHHGQLEGQAD